jgi:hypothetical protein
LNEYLQCCKQLGLTVNRARKDVEKQIQAFFDKYTEDALKKSLIQYEKIYIRDAAIKKIRYEIEEIENSVKTQIDKTTRVLTERGFLHSFNN